MFFGCNFLFIQGKEGSCYHGLESDISRLHLWELKFQGPSLFFTQVVFNSHGVKICPFPRCVYAPLLYLHISSKSPMRAAAYIIISFPYNVTPFLLYHMGNCYLMAPPALFSLFMACWLPSNCWNKHEIDSDWISKTNRTVLCSPNFTKCSSFHHT